eukprot:Pgem_evm3s4369
MTKTVYKYNIKSKNRCPNNNQSGFSNNFPTCESKKKKKRITTKSYCKERNDLKEVRKIAAVKKALMKIQNKSDEASISKIDEVKTKLNDLYEQNNKEITEKLHIISKAKNQLI